MRQGSVSVRYAFGDCILDSDTRQVCRAGQPVHLGPKAWDLLQVLLGARPRVLSKLQLLAAVWPETTVSESSLSTIVAELRDALGDTAREARYVRTVYGYGYAFAARVTPLPAVSDPPLASPAVCCRLIWGEDGIEVREGAHLIGRAPDALVTIDDPLVSRHHARVTLAGGVLTLEDLGSRNGTSRNGQRVSAPALLINGDVIGVGPVQLRVSLGGEFGVSTLSASASRLDAAAHDPAAVDDNRLARHVAARR
jgi:DNA-binding winged helix-turn-helix (wHTH) protein